MDPDLTASNAAVKRRKHTLECLTVDSSTIMLDASTCHFRGAGPILSHIFYF